MNDEEKPADYEHRGVKFRLWPDGRLHAKVEVGRKPNGQRDRRHLSGQNTPAGKRTLKAKVDKLLDAKAKKAVPKAGRYDVEKWIHYWMTEIAPYGERPVSANSRQSYWSIIETWIIPHLGALQLDDVDAEALNSMYNAMRRKRLAKTTIAKCHAIIRRALGVALQWGRVGRNVAAELDNPGSTKTRRRRAPDLKQTLRLLDVIDTRPNGLRWRFALETGLRQGEVLGLRWAFVDLAARTVVPDWQLVRLTYQHGCADPVACAAEHHRGECERPARWEHGCPNPAQCPGRSGKILARPKPAYCPQRRQAPGCRRHGQTCPEPCPPGCVEHAAKCPSKAGGLTFIWAKTVDRDDPDPDDDTTYEEYAEEEAAHTVTISPELAALLREHRKRQKADRRRLGGLWQDHDLVFCHDDGRPIDPGVDLDDWYAIQKDAGFKPVGTHASRRAAATVRHELGEAIEDIQAALRHRDPRTTRDYFRVTKELSEKGASKVGKALHGKRKKDRGDQLVTKLVTKPKKRRSS